MTTNKSILVIGAGDVGLPILRALAARAPDHNISVLLRPATISSTSPDKLSLLSVLGHLNIALIPGDVVACTESELTKLFAPFHTIIQATGVASGFASTDSLLKTVRAVIAAKTPRFIPWQFGFDYDAMGYGTAQPLGDQQFELRKLLRAQSVTEWIIVSTGLVMEVLFYPPFGILDREGGVFRGLGSWENRVTLTTLDDVGRLTVEVLFAEPAFRNEIVLVAGETASYAQIAEEIEGVIGRRLKRELWTVEQLEERLRKNPDDLMGKWNLTFARGIGVAWDEEGTYNVRKGIKVVGVEEFAQSQLKTA